jgi:hypothetical protein
MILKTLTIDVLITPDFMKAVFGLLLLIVLDLTAGIALALKLRKFELKKVADFYISSVLPYVIVWAVVDIAIRVAGFYELPIVTAIQPFLEAVSLGAVTVSLAAHIGDKLVKIKADVTVG